MWSASSRHRGHDVNGHDVIGAEGSCSRWLPSARTPASARRTMWSRRIRPDANAPGHKPQSSGRMLRLPLQPRVRRAGFALAVPAAAPVLAVAVWPPGEPGARHHRRSRCSRWFLVTSSVLRTRENPGPWIAQRGKTNVEAKVPLGFPGRRYHRSARRIDPRFGGSGRVGGGRAEQQIRCHTPAAAQGSAS